MSLLTKNIQSLANGEQVAVKTTVNDGQVIDQSATKITKITKAPSVEGNMPSVSDELEDYELWDRIYDVWYAYCSAERQLDDWTDEDGNEATPEQHAALVDEMAGLIKACFGSSSAKGLGAALLRIAQVYKDVQKLGEDTDQKTKGNPALTTETQGEPNAVNPDESKGTGAPDVTKSSEALATKPAPETTPTSEPNKAADGNDLVAAIKELVETMKAREASAAELASVGLSGVTPKETDPSAKAIEDEIAARQAELDEITAKADKARTELDALRKQAVPSPLESGKALPADELPETNSGFESTSKEATDDGTFATRPMADFLK